MLWLHHPVALLTRSDIQSINGAGRGAQLAEEEKQKSDEQ
jgi:hypothetical protein